MNFLKDVSIVTIGKKNEINRDAYNYNQHESEIVNIETKYASKIKKLIKALDGFNYKNLPNTKETTHLIFRGFKN